MQANWSLILNVLLLVGVVVAIARLMKGKKQHDIPVSKNAYQPVLSKVEDKYFDDIIAVRKIQQDFSEDDFDANVSFPVEKQAIVDDLSTRKMSINDDIDEDISVNESNEPGQSIMMFLLAKEGRTLAGYELLQSVLAAGLRFGEGHIFHRHQHPNGQGPILCSLAAATKSGVFDLQNIGAFSVRGLCLFMRSSGHSNTDTKRLKILFATARQLSENLDAHLLDDQQRPLNEESLAHYCHLLNIKERIDYPEEAIPA